MRKWLCKNRKNIPYFLCNNSCHNIHDLQQNVFFLRQLELRDSNAIFAAYAYDHEVTRHLSCNPHSKKTETKALIKRFLADDQTGLSLTWIIEKSDKADLTDIIGRKINGLKKHWDLRLWESIGE